MKSMQRLAGRMTKRSADQQDVGAVIAEFKATDDMLDRLMKDLKTWRDSWDDVLRYQYDASEAFASLYKPIEPSSDPEMKHTPVQTPRDQMQRCLALQKMYSDLKVDLKQEVDMITNKIMRPVEEAKRATKSLQKTLKHRENMKLDFERYLSRAQHSRAKTTKSVKEEAALAKHEADLQQAEIDYQTADDHVKQTIPPVTEAIQSLLPFILTTQIQIQHTLVGQLYTSLDGYSRQQGLPSPAPSDGEIISVHDQQFTGLRHELEGGIKAISEGKAVRLGMNIPDKTGSTVTGLGIRNKASGMVHRTKPDAPIQRPEKPATFGAQNGHSSYGAGQVEEDAPPKPPRPGASSGFSPSPAVSPGPNIPFGNKPRMPSYSNHAPYDHKASSLMPSVPSQPPPAYSEASTPASHYMTPPNGGTSPRPGSTKNDYFGGMPPLDRKTSAQSVASSVASIAAGKKKPPPPVPAKRMPSHQGTFVTALYDFDGQTPEDLPFREGDRIKVIKKTDSTDDWWDGELNGRRGQFPANYVQL